MPTLDPQFPPPYLPTPKKPSPSTQPIGASLLDFDIAEILAELPELQFPQSQYPNLFPEANRPTYSYSAEIHPNGLEEDIPPRTFETNVTAHMLRVHRNADFIPYHSYTISLAKNREQSHSGDRPQTDAPYWKLNSSSYLPT